MPIHNVVVVGRRRQHCRNCWLVAAQGCSGLADVLARAGVDVMADWQAWETLPIASGLACVAEAS